jgi:hypothetical protein
MCAHAMTCCGAGARHELGGLGTRLECGRCMWCPASSSACRAIGQQQLLRTHIHTYTHSLWEHLRPHPPASPFAYTVRHALHVHVHTTRTRGLYSDHQAAPTHPLTSITKASAAAKLTLHMQGAMACGHITMCSPPPSSSLYGAWTARASQGPRRPQELRRRNALIADPLDLNGARSRLPCPANTSSPHARAMPSHGRDFTPPLVAQTAQPAGWWRPQGHSGTQHRYSQAAATVWRGRAGGRAEAAHPGSHVGTSRVQYVHARPAGV